MKACVLTRFGNTDALAVRHDLPVPQPGAREVLVRVDATSVNLIDCGRRSGYGAPLFRLKGAKSFPMVLGTDFSGVVTAVGGRIKTLKVGDRVWGAKGHGRWGSYAEYVVVPESEVGPRPARLGTHEAAALPYAALTGWKAVTHGLRLNEHNSAGKRVLVHAGAGGVGSFAIQLLRNWGAEVITTCSAGNAALCLSLGAAHAIDYTRQDFSSLLRNLDAVLDTVGGDVEARSLSTLKVHGGAAYATVHGKIVRSVIYTAGQLVTLDLVPVHCLVEWLDDIGRELAHEIFAYTVIYVSFPCALSNSKVRTPARISWIIDIPTFVSQNFFKSSFPVIAHTTCPLR